MQLLRTCLITATLTVPISGYTETFLSGENVVYRGDATAARICRAVVHDDTVALKQGLRRIRNQTLTGYKFDLNGDAIAGSVVCNQKVLLMFADEIGARNVSNRLRKGSVTVEEVVSTSR